MMQTIRDSSQQDRRVYVGNLSYDVKWHHLKDFMRQGMAIQKLHVRSR
jgi:RNA recognition motif-containing protein